jgi:flavodoxin-like protein
MKIAVVYESWFGNTRAIAESIALALRSVAEVTLASVDEPVPALDELDLLIVGAPTHAHGLSSTATRDGAIAQRGGGGHPGIGVRGWLRQLPPGGGPRAAAFDTRIERSPVLVGSAARGIARRLERRGYELAAPPKSFFVSASAGPLEHGEVERAAAWALHVAARKEAVV